MLTHTHDIIFGGLIAETQLHSKNIENNSLHDQLMRTIASDLLASAGFLPSLSEWRGSHQECLACCIHCGTRTRRQRQKILGSRYCGYG